MYFHQFEENSLVILVLQSFIIYFQRTLNRRVPIIVLDCVSGFKSKKVGVWGEQHEDQPAPVLGRIVWVR